jgi:transposase-like protein
VVLAIEPGHRESAPSWASLLRGLRERGLKVPRLLIADGRRGIWAAMAEVFPEVADQRCWNHKIRNVLDRLPKRLQDEARVLRRQVAYADTRQEAEWLRDLFVERFGDDHPAAADTLLRDLPRMVSFYDFPREHWKHLRTTNPVESPFAAVRLRTDAGKRYKKVANATALIWRLLLVAESTFRRLHHPELLPEVALGTRYRSPRVLPARSAAPGTFWGPSASCP